MLWKSSERIRSGKASQNKSSVYFEAARRHAWLKARLMHLERSRSVADFICGVNWICRPTFWWVIQRFMTTDVELRYDLEKLRSYRDWSSGIRRQKQFWRARQILWTVGLFFFVKLFCHTTVVLWLNWSQLSEFRGFQIRRLWKQRLAMFVYIMWLRIEQSMQRALFISIW